MRSLSSHLVKRLTRLSGLVPSGIVVATLGSWVLLLPTIPLMSAASVVTCLATMPVGWPGYPCVQASRMARYRRRLSLIVCSFWIGRAFQRAYPMGQPLNYLFQNDLEKCPVEKYGIRAVSVCGASPLRARTGRRSPSDAAALQTLAQTEKSATPRKQQRWLSASRWKWRIGKVYASASR